MQQKEAAGSYLVISFAQARLYGVRTSVTHPSALNRFQNLLISEQEWAMASQKMESFEPLPKSQTQTKPKCLC